MKCALHTRTGGITKAAVTGDVNSMVAHPQGQSIPHVAQVTLATPMAFELRKL